MAHAFHRAGSRIEGRLDSEEIAVVTQLLRLTRDFVAPERDDTGDPFLDLVAGLGESDPDPDEPSDPALRRLLPPASQDDAEQAAEFRRLTEHSLRSRKASTLGSAIAALQEARPPQVSLDDGQTQALAIALTDVRLVLGERLGLRTDEDSDRLHSQLETMLLGEGDMDPAQAQQMAYYDFLTWLQETLTQALMDR